MFLYSVKILGNRADAFDLTQDVFVKVAAKLGQLKKAITFRKWLFRIVYNDAIDQLKKNKKQVWCSIDSLADIPTKVFDYENALKQDWQFNQLEAALTQISIEDKQLLSERYFEEKSIRNLSQQYQLSESAIKMRLARSRKRVHKFIAA